MQLSKRLYMNAELVPDGSSVADIGCDHGYVSIYLAEKKNCRVIAMDVKEGPLSIAKKNISRAGLQDIIECRLSDGLTELEPGEADTLLLAGMGGRLILSILQKKPEVMRRIQTLVLQPQSDFREVRAGLSALGFVIQKESYCMDAGKDYVAICAERVSCEHTGSGQNYSEAELCYGRFLKQIKDTDYYNYLLREKQKYIKIREGLKRQVLDVGQIFDVCWSAGNCRQADIEYRIGELTHILDMLEQSLW